MKHMDLTLNTMRKQRELIKMNRWQRNRWQTRKSDQKMTGRQTTSELNHTKQNHELGNVHFQYSTDEIW